MSYSSDDRGDARSRQNLMSVVGENSNEFLPSSLITTDLKGFFEKSNKTENLNVLTNKAYHHVYEVAFKITREEMAKLASPQRTKTTLAAAHNRLSACADAIRLAVKAGASKLKKKTVKAVVDHITQTLPQTNGDYFPGLSPSYLKALSHVFEHTPHAERLSPELWTDVVNFCLEGIIRYVDSASESATSQPRTYSGLGASSGAGSLPQSSFPSGRSQSVPGSISRQDIEDLLKTLLPLVSLSSTSLMSRADEISHILLRLLKMNSSIVSTVHQLGLSILNRVLSSCREDKCSLVESIALEAIDLFPKFWQGKFNANDQMLNSVRDETLILFFSVHLHLELSLLADSEGILSQKLADLLNVFRAEYTRRSERDQIQLEDLDMQDLGGEREPLTPFTLQVFRLRPHDTRSERNWANLQVIGLLERLVTLGAARESLIEPPNGSMNEHPRKRQKTERHSDHFIDLIRSDNEKERLAGLQTLPFILQFCQLSDRLLKELLLQLSLCISDKRGQIASWALLAIASCTYQESAQDRSFTAWLQLWRLGGRALTFHATCRAAATQLHAIAAAGLVKYHEVAEDINSMLAAADINGPTACCDSSVFFMMHILSARTAEVPGASQAASHHVIRWLFARWNSGDTSVGAQSSIQMRPQDLVDLLRTCFGLARAPVQVSDDLVGGPIAQAWQRHLATEEVLRYLLLLDDSPKTGSVMVCTVCPRHFKVIENKYILDDAHFRSTRKLVLELLAPKLRALLQSWTSLSHAMISGETFRRTFHAGLTMLLMLAHFTDSNLPQVQSTEADLESLTAKLIEFLSSGRNTSVGEAIALTRITLHEIQPYLPACNHMGSIIASKGTPHLLKFFFMIAGAMAASTMDFNDAMDLDNNDEDDDTNKGGKILAQSSQIHNEEIAQIPRLCLALEMSDQAFMIVTRERLLLFGLLNDEPQSSTTVPETFIDHLISLPDEELLFFGQLLRELLDSNLSMSNEDGARLLKRLADLIGSDEWSQCEVSRCLCLDLLIGLGPQWIEGDDMEMQLKRMGTDMYNWYTGLVLKGSQAPEVEKRLATLLLVVARLDPANSLARSNAPSARTCLINILEKSSISVRFFIGARLPGLFEMYLIDNHDTIFVDIQDHLPQDPSWIEGIAFRVFVFAKVGSRWPHLLRRCVYHMFEVPHGAPGSLDYATRCLSDLTKALSITSPRDILSLFAPQILFTWLEHETIETIPFQIFGFSTLRDFLFDVKDVTVGVLFLHDHEKQLEQLAEILVTNTNELLQSTFTTVTAYNIAQSSSNHGKDKHLSESWIAQSLGNEIYSECLNANFADIIALLFNTIDGADMEKSLLKNKASVHAGETMKIIKGFDESALKLPPNQQPSFRSRNLTSWISHLCSKTKHTPESLYTPALITSIARSLLNTMHPALGHLHYCSVIRKLRILISLAGPVALQGYPLEMLIQSISVYAAVPECAEDASGIIQYLFLYGTDHLSAAPSFVAGSVLSLFGRLRRFIGQRQSSTTQDSQYKGAKSKAQKLHRWLKDHVLEYKTNVLNKKELSNFQSLLEAASEIGLVGNANASTPESDLLIFLLQDEQRSRPLLSRPAREVALAMLSSDFTLPVSVCQDVLGKDHRAIGYAAVVWKSCRGSSASKEYLSWAGRVLGRAFAASGHLHHELLQESSRSQIDELAPPPDITSDDASKACLLILIQSLTLGSDQCAVGLAEVGLRSIVSSATTLYDTTLKEICYKSLSRHLADASDWLRYTTPPSETRNAEIEGLSDPFTIDAITRSSWLCDLAVVLARHIPDDPVLTALVPILLHVSGFPERAFPFILHIALSTPSKAQHLVRKNVSRSFADWFSITHPPDKSKLRLLLNSILYLRTQPHPQEQSSKNGAHWLDLDYLKAAVAASKCGMYKTALLFVEEHFSRPTAAKALRRSSAMPQEPDELPRDLLLTIFESIDDPDLYYGVRQTASLSTILGRLEYERDGPKSLAFRGAQYDSHVRQLDPRSAEDAQSLVKALDALSQSGLSFSLHQAQQAIGMGSASLDSMFDTARKLEKWDIPVPNNYSSGSVTIYKALQAVQSTSSDRASLQVINEGFDSTMASLIRNESSANALHGTLRTLAVLAELDEVVTTRSSQELEDVLLRFRNRAGWMNTGRFDDINPILSCRGTTLSILSQNPRLQQIVNIVPLDARLVEVHIALLASDLSRSHNALQESLAIATSLLGLIGPCNDVGLKVEAAVRLEEAHVMWDHGEMSSSIKLLQNLRDGTDLNKQTIPVGCADLLSRIGSQISTARLEKSDDILKNYLKPALDELKHKVHGKEAGHVFHQFATFCDQQLQDADGLEDLERVEKMCKEKRDDVHRLEKMSSSSTPNAKEKKNVQQQLSKSRTWLKIDEAELKRHQHSRDEFLQKALENYLLALRASDEHDKNALRFTSLWMRHCDEENSNSTVAQHIGGVPSYKFAPLMNQLSSRLQSSEESFQKSLFALVLQICIDHPYSGMYQIYAIANSRANSKDEAAVSRHAAATNISKKLHQHEKCGNTWLAVSYTNRGYAALANERDDRYKTGAKIPIGNSPYAKQLQTIIAKYQVPPPTMQIKPIASLDYSRLPKMAKLEPIFTIANGVSAPKIITILGTNGVRYRQLVKGGNDDLRQDAIMEQVFEQVSELLKINRTTRQRDLKIRTYKVLPLTAVAGVIEFVPDTIPLHEYLLVAHVRYYPKDLTGNECRKYINNAQSKSNQERVKAFRAVMEKFHPVMRYFFIERFSDPDEWFVKRLAYTRSTAAISILGHVLGLGDRHGHNILLDSKSGEVVHIDLGVAFEMGRILPVPEVVPFRLTRDIVDGMGITKTEGVFRRCCEFTLEALRKEKDSINAILNVLRYDPLYSWSVSPLRLAKLQEGQSAAPEADVDAEVVAAPSRVKQSVNEPGEADRALTTINKKLSKTLSVTATVNDLINQAMDERNLAVLYSGWGAYC
ncbi:hypothetical protein BJ878DRAFT_541328 [Calycina marina]|uniref:Serine/threonine-protein kinase Tel1 n=1 Tax=Calycina marina TaxID=1763456 RepID=A0A9P7Z512_9HELO|nr:hypothetical protein BJ878DRAFT_541328 [Calycina marina]